MHILRAVAVQARVDVLRMAGRVGTMSRRTIPKQRSWCSRPCSTSGAMFVTFTARSSEEVRMKRKRKMTPEELAAREARDRDLTRRLEEMIERYRKLNAERRAAGSE